MGRSDPFSGWNFSNGDSTVPIETEDEFTSALEQLLGGEPDDTSETETA